MPVSPSMRTVMPRWRSHSISLGTSSPAASEFGLDMMPTVLMKGIEEKILISVIEEKLLVPFGAGDGALDNRGFEPDFAHGPFHFLASRPVQFRLAHDAALADLALAHFKLRFDQYNHLPGGL